MVVQVAVATDTTLSQGVIFKLVGERAFTDSKWTVVTDISFNQADSTFITLTRWLTQASIMDKPVNYSKEEQGARFHHKPT